VPIPAVSVRADALIIGAIIARKERLVEQWRSSVRRRLQDAGAGEWIHSVHALVLADASARVLVHGQVAHPAFSAGVQSALTQLDRFALPGAGA
jgi:hypothetical protein